VQMTGGEFGVRPASRSGSTSLQSIPTIVFDPTEGRWYAATVNVLSDGVTWSQGTDLRNRRLQGRRSERRLIGLKIPCNNVKDRGR